MCPDFGSSLPTRTENNGDIVAAICDGTTSSQKLAVDAAGKVEVKLDDASGNGITSQANGVQRALDVGINVAGVQVDPRDVRALTNADVVTAEQGGTWDITDITGTISLPTGAATETTLAAINSKLVSGTDIGDVTVNNGSGAGAVNIQDGGNSITVDGTVAATQSGTWDIGTVSTITNVVHVDDNGGSITVDGSVTVSATDLDIRDLTATDVVSVNIRDASGTAFSAGNPLPVSVVSTTTGTDVLDYHTSASVAAGASVNHDYTVTSGKTLSLQQISASASGKIKIEIKINSATKVVKFNSTAETNIDHFFQRPQEIAAGIVVRVTITNLDKSAMDVYSTLEGFEY